MSGILITGASGFIGSAVARTLARGGRDVVCMSRHRPSFCSDEIPWVRGSFGAFEDLRRLDEYEIEAIIHLGAVTGGCLERNGIRVNVEGTRCLMRYLIDSGCNKFVMASSTAVVGFEDPGFRPRELPIPDEHPCLDRHGYGFSKFMMEEVTKYYQRQNEAIDVINLRFASIADDDDLPDQKQVATLPPETPRWALASITVMALSDAVRALTMALDTPHKPGVRILNATAPRAWVADPVADVLRHWWGHDVDLSYYEREGYRYASAFDVSHIREELGFEAQVLGTGM